MLYSVLCVAENSLKPDVSRPLKYFSDMRMLRIITLIAAPRQDRLCPANDAALIAWLWLTERELVVRDSRLVDEA